MRICYVINSLDGGGGALPLPGIISVMREAGHEVFVVALMERNGRARRVLDAAATPYLVIGGAKRSFVRTALRLNGIVSGERPDILWTSLSHATVTGQLVGKLQGIPVISWLHNAWLKPINAHIMRRTAGLTRHWVADSNCSARFGSDTLGIDPIRISTWPLFQADALRPVAQSADAHGVFRIGSLGRLHRNKGYDVLIDAMALLTKRNPRLARRIAISVAGEGEERSALQQRATGLGLSNVEFAGFREPAGFLAGLHCYVQPSHHEGLCIAAHEAMLAGLPVIASPVGEMAHSVATSGGGALVDYGDAEGLSRALETYAANPQRACAEGAAARKWVLEHYSVAAFRARGLAAIAAAGLPVSG